MRFQKLKDEPLEELSGFQTPNFQYQKSEVPSSWKPDTYVQTPVERANQESMYGGICNPRTGNNIYTLGPEKAMPKETIPTATLPDQYKVPHRFKPSKLPEFDKTKGVHTYLTL